MKIPIKNLYYLLVYAWNCLEESELVGAGAVESNELHDLLARVLRTGLRYLLRRGLDRGYEEHQEVLPCLRGRVEWPATIKRNLLEHGKAACVFDELTHDVVHNQILKATVTRLIWMKSLNRELRHDLAGLHRRMGSVGDVDLRPELFRKVQLHRNTAFYKFLLNVCWLFCTSLLPDESSEDGMFRDFTKDEGMRTLFEQFVRNFYRREQSAFKVKAKQMAWQRVEGDDSALALLPGLKTDVTLSSPTRTIVLDTKYTPKTLQEYRQKKTYRSEHLFQLFAYLKNTTIVEKKTDTQIEGVLLYPTVNETLDERFSMHGHPIHIATLDLAQPWTGIRDRLHELLAGRP